MLWLTAPAAHAYTMGQCSTDSGIDYACVQNVCNQYRDSDDGSFGQCGHGRDASQGTWLPDCSRPAATATAMRRWPLPAPARSSTITRILLMKKLLIAG